MFLATFLTCDQKYYKKTIKLFIFLQNLCTDLKSLCFQLSPNKIYNQGHQIYRPCANRAFFSFQYIVRKAEWNRISTISLKCDNSEKITLALVYLVHVNFYELEGRWSCYSTNSKYVIYMPNQKGILPCKEAKKEPYVPIVGVLPPINTCASIIMLFGLYFVSFGSN